nr:MAG TPA: hypothetical protein [Caudoviricetes sp.]
MTNDTKIRIVNILYHSIAEQLQYMKCLITTFHNNITPDKQIPEIEDLQKKVDIAYVEQDIDLLISWNTKIIYYKTLLNQETQNVLMDSFSYNQLVDHIITNRIKEQLDTNNLTAVAVYNKLKEQINYTRIEDLEDIDIAADVLSPKTITLFLYYLLINGEK